MKPTLASYFLLKLLTLNENIFLLCAFALGSVCVD